MNEEWIAGFFSSIVNRESAIQVADQAFGIKRFAFSVLDNS
jgi:hypothetical protein